MEVENIVALAILIALASGGVSGDPDYHDALSKSLLLFHGQRSGGYYDAGDNVKFGLPMAFTTTMLAWSVLEFGRWMPKELNHAREAVRWGTDYLLKASGPLPSALYVQVCTSNLSRILSSFYTT
ncbi:hypothetical protein GW17_00059990 [Ensete ventricosum]|nr:hypothetical protein GW17_00059990 [Ensete ventricosum]